MTSFISSAKEVWETKEAAKEEQKPKNNHNKNGHSSDDHFPKRSIK